MSLNTDTTCLWDHMHTAIRPRLQVRTTTALLNCFGRTKEANRLRNGHAMWEQTMEPKNNFRWVRHGCVTSHPALFFLMASALQHGQSHSATKQPI